MRSCDTLPAHKLLLLLLLILFCAFAHASASGQTGGRRTTAPQRPPRPSERSTLIAPEERGPAPVARASESACGGLPFPEGVASIHVWPEGADSLP